MGIKTVKIDVVNRPNSLITVIGRDMGAISADKVEAVVDNSISEAQLIVNKARSENNYRQLITDETKIKSLIIMTNGIVYPSSFRVVTLIERIREATTEINDIIKTKIEKE